MVSIKQMKSLISSVCEDMGKKFSSEDAINLVLATGIVESRYEYVRQMGDGPARSFWQVEAATAVDNLAHYLKHRPDLMKKCAKASMVDVKHWQSFEEDLWEEILEKNRDLIPICTYYMRRRKPHTIVRLEFPKKYLSPELRPELNFAIA